MMVKTKVSLPNIPAFLSAFRTPIAFGELNQFSRFELRALKVFDKSFFGYDHHQQMSVDILIAERGGQLRHPKQFQRSGDLFDGEVLHVQRNFRSCLPGNRVSSV
jgi:hypothetical protein